MVIINFLRKKSYLIMKLRVFSMLFTLTMSLISYGQVSSNLRTVAYNNVKILTTPDIFNTWLTGDAQLYYSNKLLSLNSLNSTNNKPWCVFSDRSRNPVLTAQGSPTGKLLDFMQPLYVSDVYQQKFLEIYGYEEDNNGTPVFKKLGYINKEKILLSSFSSLNQYGASRHAMICYAIRGDVNVGDDVADILDNKNRFYLTPTEQDDQGVPEKFKIYFVLKEVNNVLLLSTKDQISENDKLNRSIIPGWIKSMLVTSWDHKICLEPNFGSKVDPYKNIENIDDEFQNAALVFGTKKTAKSVDYYGKLDSSSIDDLLCKWPLKKYGPSHFRLPIVAEINEEDKNIRKVASLVKQIGGDIGNSSGGEDLINKLTEQVKTVNILIVIDGSSSMQPYFNAVANSLYTINQNMKASGFKKVKIGVSIYRDESDGAVNSLISKTSNYTRDYEFLPLTNDLSIVEDYLRESGSTYQNIFSLGQDRYESMFKGLKRAIIDAKFNPQESNVMYVIGDCGNHPTDNVVKLNELSNLVAKYNINIQAFQVNYGLSTSDEKNNNLINPYLKFRKDISSIIKESTRIRLENGKVITSSNEVQNNVKYRYENSKMRNSDEINLYTGLIPYKNLPISNRFTYTENVMEASIFSDNTKKSLNDYFKLLNNQLAEITSGMRKNNGKHSEISVATTIAALRGCDERTLDALRNYGSMSFIGYTLNEFYNLGVKAFSTVVFITLQEKQAMVNKLVNVVEKSGGGSEKRSNFKKAIIELVGGLMGQNDNMVVEKLTLKTIWEKTLGVKFNREYESIGNIPIGLLDQNSVLSDKEFEQFYAKFKSQVTQFRNYRESADDGGIGEIGGQSCLWIPTRVFPMCDYE